MGHPFDAHVTPQHNVESHFARFGVRAGLHPNIVNVRVGVIVARTAHGNVEFARQIAPVRIAAGLGDGIQTDQIVQGVAKVARVDHFLIVDTGEGRTDHVADIVQGRLKRRLIAIVQALNDIGSVFDFDASQLNVLTRGNVHDTFFGSVLFDAVGVKSHLICIDNAVGYLETHHKLTRCAFTAVQHADPFQARIQIGLFDLFPGQFGIANLLGKLVHIDKGGRPILGQLDFFNGAARFGALNGVLWQKRRARGFDNGGRFGGGGGTCKRRGCRRCCCWTMGWCRWHKRMGRRRQEGDQEEEGDFHGCVDCVGMNSWER
mmetsp:Transcript_13952/g.30507  ORF Transcript_13952/g.30507 Transcript_13952/m.30507 type:complete len:318 (+) Transcript_13952:1068-2021(+)